jgi:hypothetical protein
MTPVSGETSAAIQDNSGSSARGITADYVQPLDAIGEALLVKGFDLFQLGVARGNDQLAAFAVRHAMRCAKGIEQQPALRAVARAQRMRRIIHSSVDDLAVARGNAGADGGGHFGDDDVVAGKRRGARDRETDDPGSDDENLHRAILTQDRCEAPVRQRKERPIGSRL